MVAVSSNAATEPFFSAVGPDARADRGRREIAISGERVTINRKVRGIDMRLSLALAAYSGVALCLRPGLHGQQIYQIRLVHRDQDLSVMLDEALHDDEIIADWRLWARVLGLPALVERDLGHYEPAATASRQSLSGHRRVRPLKRRPRFLARRRMGHGLGTMVVHTDEREIVARH